MCNPIFSWEICPAISEFVLITTSSSLYPEHRICILHNDLFVSNIYFRSRVPFSKEQTRYFEIFLPLLWLGFLWLHLCTYTWWGRECLSILGCAPFPFSLNSTVELIHRNITSIQRWEINMRSMWWGNVKLLVWQWLVQPWELICWVN